MATTAFKTVYGDEWIAKFEQRQSLIRETTYTKYDVNGNQAVFLTSGSGDEAAVTRGANGLIPAIPADYTQSTCTLEERHAKRVETRFNIVAGQGNKYQMMQDSTVAIINRHIDQQIITELNTGTQNTGAATTASLDLATHALAILGNAEVELDGQICALITPAARSYLMRDTEFSSADFVKVQPLADGGRMDMYAYGYYEWAGVKWIVHPKLPGAGTAAEKCFMYHRNAIGSAYSNESMDVDADYESEDDYSWARATVFSGAKLLQNSGVVVMNHDGSALAAA